jgi:preprotein translocase subunit SecA
MQLLRKLFGTKHQRDIKLLRPLVDRVNEFERQYQSLSEEAIKQKTVEFRARLAKGETLDDLMCEAFAAVKNTCRRLCGTKVDMCGREQVWDMIPYDVQIIGGIVLHQGKIAEMATGEGKTLVATMPLYLNALAGNNVRLVTVNDYLARRDAQWMGHIYTYLGLSVGCIQNQMDFEARRCEYSKDITYGTNSEFGFDYLRDNGMAYSADAQVQRGYHFAIIDEVDSILIDEARTPLIISGPVAVSTHQFDELKPRVEELVRRQRTLCNNLIQEAKEALDGGQIEKAQLLIYQVYHGMPKHKQLMKMLEEPSTRKLHEQVESMMLTDMRKEQGRELREALYFSMDERTHDASLTDRGCEALHPTDPNMFVMPDLVSHMAELDVTPGLTDHERTRRRLEIQESFNQRSERIHNVDQLIRAYCLYERDVEYVVQGNQVLIVDEFTGRILPGRRWSDGLHQAVEAKEGVKIERETQTLATITIQNYFRMYKKLAGMTGTAETEANEFRDIYNLDVVVIPTNRPVRRVDSNDVVYKTQREKFKAIVDEIEDCHKRGQPVLLGTISVETSELISRMLRRSKIPHNVLNAKNHEREAEIVAGAGQAGSVTIATNMAGRGTDIKLGASVVWLDRQVVMSQASLNDKVGEKTMREALTEKPCGLHVIGSERHEARRIDRQLRGRCARQGDPGSSRFYVSLEDDLMRLFGSDRIAGVMSRLGLEEGQQLEHRWLNRSIETAQRRVEQQNFSIRKRTLEYDDVMNRQRTVVYGLRGDIVRSENIRNHIYEMFEDAIVRQIEGSLTDDSDSGVQALVEWVQSTFPISLRKEEVKQTADREALADEIMKRAKEAYELKVSMEDANMVKIMERQILLQIIDSQWQDYLRGMDALRQGVGLRAYGQRDPLVEYKREAYMMFDELMKSISLDISGAVFRSTTAVSAFERFLSAMPRRMVHDQVAILGRGRPEPQPETAAESDRTSVSVSDFARIVEPVTREGPKVGRNDLCPCGSGKKYKKCCGVSS